MKKKMYWFITVLASITLIFMLFEQILAVSFVDSKAGITDSSAGANNTNKESLSVNLLKDKTGSTFLNNIAGDKNTKDYVDGEVLVKYKNDKINLDTSTGKVAALNVISAKSLETKEDLTKINTSLLKITDGKSVEDKVFELKNDPNVEYAEPNFKRYLASISTNDPDRGELWGLDNTGQTVNGTAGTVDKDIDAPEAWAINEGTNGTVIVAVIDTGVAYNHPDLNANMWNGASCKDENGSPLGACNHGYDYADNDKTPFPEDSSHGTHVAGTIAAVKNNSTGLLGVAPNAKIMALRFGFETTSEVKAIDFAIQNGAKVINASYGGNTYSATEYSAINRFKTAGGIFVAAAGNSALNNDGGTHYYPSDYNLDNIISVAATTQSDGLASFSNYGATSVDVGAPGTNIYSSYAESNLVDQDFEALGAGADPAGWTLSESGSAWGTYPITSPDSIALSKVYYSDGVMPYGNNANSTATLPVADLSNATGSRTGGMVEFLTTCDTETGTIDDYMQLYFSANGVDFNDMGKWNEDYGTGSVITYAQYLGQDTVSGGTARTYLSVPIPLDNSYLTSNFRTRFKWYTDASVASDDGCSIDKLKIIRFNDGTDEDYSFSQGTSMAAPHVAGLAALIEGYKPTLTSSEVKSLILTSGDDISSLHGKTSAGTRINDIALRSDGTSGYTLNGWGGIHPFGGAPAISQQVNWIGWDIARAIVLRSDGQSGYVLNGWGGIHPFGGAPAISQQVNWIGQDIARDIVLRSDGQSGYVLNKYGGIHAFGGAPQATNPSPVWWSGIARAIVLKDDNSGYVLNGWGGIHPFGGSPAISQQTHWIGWDIARDFDLRSDKTSGYVLNGWGGVHPFGGAPSIPNQTNWINWDIARAIKLVR